MGGVFLSYRRDDASGWAGRLYEYLERDLGRGAVFMDIDAIAPGEDFREAIRRTIDSSDTVLVVIGPSWLNVRDDSGRRRLDDETDTHRTEVVSALRAGVRVVPVLVGGATMPPLAELPEALRDLAFRNAAVVEDRRFGDDAARLVEAVRRDRPVPAKGQPEVRDVYRSDSRSPAGRSLSSVPGVVVAAGVLVVLCWGVLVPRGWHPELSAVRIGAAVLVVIGVLLGAVRRSWGWAVIGGVIGALGFLLWAVQLVAQGHTTADLFSPGTDGVPNMLTLLGMAAVVVAAAMGARNREA